MKKTMPADAKVYQTKAYQAKLEQYENFCFTPSEFLAFLREWTDENGILTLPCHYDDSHEEDMEQDASPDAPDYFEEFRMSWEEAGCREILAEHERVCRCIREIRALRDPETDEPDVSALNAEQSAVWDVYLRSLEPEGFDAEKISEILEKENECIALTPEEKALDRAYLQAKIAECERRVGPGACAYNRIIYARRVDFLLKLGAPQVVLEREILLFLEAMLLHRFADR